MTKEKPKKKKEEVYDISKLRRYTDPMIAMDGPVKLRVYKSGNSNVVTIPHFWDINEGDELLASKKQEKLILKRLSTAKMREEIKKRKLEKFVGSHHTKILEGKNIKDLEKILEGVYER